MEADRIFAVPGGCINIVFCCDEDNPSANVCGSVTHGKKVFYKPNCEYFGIRLLPGYDRHFLKFPAKEFVDSEVPLNEILDKKLFIAERIAKGISFSDRICIAETCLRQYIDNVASIPYLSRYIIEKIYKTNGQLKIQELADETGYSSRYICRIFEDCIGISPKLFSRIVRFQKVLGILLRDGVSKLDDIAYMFGYYDQSHFLRECKEFCFLPLQQTINYKNDLVRNIPQ